MDDELKSSSGSSFKAYRNAQIIHSSMQDDCVIGEDSYINRCQFDIGVQINRRNMIVNTSIGRHTYTGQNTTIKGASIGPFCSISWNVSIGGAEHDYTRRSTHPFTLLPQFGFVEETKEYASSSLPLEIGADVWIGAGASILRGVKIGIGAVVGSNAVVTKDVPPYAIVVGSPARILKYRFSDTVIDSLLEEKWWEWSDEKIKENLHIFQSPII